MYEYKAQVVKVVDGDTVDMLFDLGFNIYHSCRVRMLGIDTPESRTRDLEEKARGKLSKQFLKDCLLDQKVVIKTHKKNAKENSVGSLANCGWTTKISIKKWLV